MSKTITVKVPAVIGEVDREGRPVKPGQRVWYELQRVVLDVWGDEALDGFRIIPRTEVNPYAESYDHHTVVIPEHRLHVTYVFLGQDDDKVQAFIDAALEYGGKRVEVGLDRHA